MKIRTVAVFHNTAQVGSAWACAEGIVTALSKEGYEVLDFGHPQNATVPLEALRKVDLVILGAPEWYGDILLARYRRGWIDLPVPKIAWYAESAYRDDRNFDFARCRILADLHYYPAMQDAEEFGGEWLPFAADPLVFFPTATQKRFDAAFLGTLYPKRVEYIRSTGFPISIMPAVHDPHPVRSTLLLAEAYRSTNIFVNLPAYSRLLVTKVTEVLACRTMLVTPAIDHPSGWKNMQQFEDGKHLVFYDQNRPTELAKILGYYTQHPAEREAIAEAGWAEVMQRHTMQHRIARMVADAERLLAQRREGNGVLQAASHPLA